MEAISSNTEVVTGLTQVVILWIVLLVGNSLATFNKDITRKFKTLIPYTADALDGTIVIHQDINAYPTTAIPVGFSVNEPTGIEFAYSFYIYIAPSTIDNQPGLKHIMHKGNPNPWPLMGPGVFFESTTNTLRVFMNTYASPYTYCNVTNFPVNKWAHVVLNCYKKGLDVYINGSLGSRIPFINTIPYQNYQDIIVFSNSSVSSTAQAVTSTGGDFNVTGPITGKISTLKYASYALSVSEIQALLTKGPSSQLAPTAAVAASRGPNIPPYLADDWWANQR